MDIFEIDLTGTIGIAAANALQRVLNCIGGLTATNVTITGRWIVLFAGGISIHRTITDSQPVAVECKSGRTFYPLIGVVCAAAFMGVVQGLPDSWFPLPYALVFRVMALFAAWARTQSAPVFSSLAIKPPAKCKKLKP